MRVLDSSQGRGFPDPEAWDRFIARDPRGHLLQTWAWGELKSAFGWAPLRLAVESDGALLAGAQVLYRRMGPFSMGYIPKGPVILEETPGVTALLWRAIHACSRRMRAVVLKVEPEWYDGESNRHEWLASQGFSPSHECIQPRSTIIVDLSPTEQEILARMKSKWRYNIRLSARKGVEVRQGTLADIDIFYSLLHTTGERDGFAIHSPDYYRRAFDLFALSNRVRLFIAYHKDRPLAALIAYAFSAQAWYMYGASSNEHRALMPNHQLQWEAMRWAKSKGCRQYDLWGIPDSDTQTTASLTGVQRFKAGFGGKRVRYVGAYDHAYSQPLYAAMRWAWARRRARA